MPVRPEKQSVSLRRLCTAAVTGRVFVAQNPEQFTYDADGNMLTDGRFRYTWNAENRLVRAQELVAPTNRHPYTITYAYDHKGRMVTKRITENDGNDTLVKSIAYVWDGWNIIREIQWPVASGQWPVVTDNIWGLDIDGTLQGAGGVGGLLAVVRDGETYFPTYDANGNVSEYVSTDGSIVAHYDYSPFGETLIETGDLASTFTHRFSTKPWCPMTGLYEYQMRKYRPGIGRWLSRDPIREKGGPNLLGFLVNSPVTKSDYIGWSDVADWITRIYFRAWWFQLALWDSDDIQTYNDGADGAMAERTQRQATQYYMKLLSESGKIKEASICWESFDFPQGETGWPWYIRRKGGIKFSDIGFWLNQGRVVTNGGSFEFRKNPKTDDIEFRNIKSEFVWHDRIDTNPSRNDPWYFWLAEMIDSVCEWITGCDFPVEITWSDVRP